MNTISRETLEAELHKAIKPYLSKRKQGYAMEKIREVIRTLAGHGRVPFMEIDAKAIQLGAAALTAKIARVGLDLGTHDAERCAEVTLRAAVETRDVAQPEPASADAADAARPKSEWHEDYGPAVWWAWCGAAWAGEPAWIGTPNDSDWPGYHTHWTPHPAMPPLRDAARAAKE